MRKEENIVEKLVANSRLNLSALKFSDKVVSFVSIFEDTLKQYKENDALQKVI